MRLTKVFLVLSCTILLTGCWDQRQFKNIKLGLAGGFDLVDENKIKATVVIPTVEQGTVGLGNEYIQVVSSVANTPREARAKIDQKISKVFDGSKVRALVVGEELSKHDIFALLDVFYRNPKTNLNAKLVVVRGTASEVLNLRVSHEPRISGYLHGMLHGQVMTTQAPNDNIQLIMAEILNPGEDFVLPMIEVNYEENLLNYIGLALFHDKSYSGITLNQEESKILLLLDNKRGKTTRITKKISDNEKESIKNYVTIDIGKLKRKLKVTADPTIKAEITLDIGASIVEFPENDLNPKKIKKLEKELSKILTAQAEEVVKKMQEANSDVFGIGSRMIAYHNKKWQKLNWKETYPTIEIKPEIKVTISNNGIIN